MTQKNKKIAIIIALTILSVALCTTTFAALTVNKSLTLTGGIALSPNIGVYSDSACLNNITSINLNNLNVGAQTNQTFYIKNTGAIALTLSMATLNWSPSNASTEVALTWNQEATRVQPDQSIPATLTIDVSSNADITTFSVQISITGTQ